MIDVIFYVAFLGIIGALILFFLKQKGSYFKPVQILFTVAFISFAAVIFCDFVKNHLVQEDWGVYYTTTLGLTAVFVAAISVEHASFVLCRKRHSVIPKTKFSVLNMISSLFKGYAVALLVATWALRPWSVASIITLWGGTTYSAVYNEWFMYSLAGFLVFFISYPCGLLMLSSLHCKEKLVSKAFAWLGASWAATGFSLIFFNGYVRSLGYEMIEIGYAMNMFFFTLIAYHFKKATILEEFFETPHQVLQVKEGEHIVVFYTSKMDKMKIFSSYIFEGLELDDRVVYVFPDEENTIVRLKLKEHGIDVEKHEKDGSLVLIGLSEAYLSNGHFNKEKLIEFWKRFKEESKKKGFKNERDLFDLGNLSFLKGEEDKYLDYLREANAQIMDTYLTELRAINVEKLDHKVVEEFKFLTTKSMDLLEHLDRFSKQLGLTHKELAGRALLLEVSPVSNYENLIQDFALEAAANIEPITVFTTRGSAVHSILTKRENARFFLLTQLISAPQPNSSQEDILLPAKNTSLLLDALNKTLKAYSYSNQNIVFDNLSALVLSVGFEKTYSFVQYALELLSSKKMTSLFLFSPSAHDSKVASGLRSLFNDQVHYSEDGLEIVKLCEPKGVRMDVGLMREVKNEKRK
jgi:KaiC/GvpD/RAD55 family RecA-like ATPase